MEYVWNSSIICASNTAVIYQKILFRSLMRCWRQWHISSVVLCTHQNIKWFKHLHDCLLLWCQIGTRTQNLKKSINVDFIESVESFKAVTKRPWLLNNPQRYIRQSMLDILEMYNESNVYLLVPLGSIRSTWLFIPGTDKLAVSAFILNTAVEQSLAKAKHGEG